MGSVGGIMQNPNDLALNMVVFLPLRRVHRDGGDRSTLKRLLGRGLCRLHDRRDRRVGIARRLPRLRS